MKAKLIKERNYYDLYRINEDGKKVTFASTQDYKQKLSKKNCDEIFGVVDVEKLAEENTHDCDTSGCYPADYFIAGFNKAMELNKDKVFTEDDVNLAFVLGKNKDESRVNKLINSRLQPTEMEVMIVMEEISSTYLVTIGEVKTTRLEPKLDSEGCLILKRVV